MNVIIVKVTDNKNPSNFIIFSTKLKDYRIKFSFLKNQYKMYKNNLVKFKPVFKVMDCEDCNACCLMKGEFRDMQEINLKIQEFNEFYTAKLKSKEYINGS